MKRHILGLGAFALSFVVGILVLRLMIFPFAWTESELRDAVAMPLQTSNGDPSSSTVSNDIAPNPEVYIELFSDEKSIGRSRKNKVEVKCFDRAESRIAEIRFFTRTPSGWEQRQVFEFDDKDDLTACDPEVSDFNDDGLNDLTYRSKVAARGANDVRRLFVYDRRDDRLIYVQNSESYPNLIYNKKLNCITSWMFHGATTTVFLKLDGNELKDFASVDTGAELVVTLTGRHGRKVIYRREMAEEDIYTRYTTFNPPKP